MNRFRVAKGSEQKFETIWTRCRDLSNSTCCADRRRKIIPSMPLILSGRAETNSRPGLNLRPSAKPTPVLPEKTDLDLVFTLARPGSKGSRRSWNKQKSSSVDAPGAGCPEKMPECQYQTARRQVQPFHRFRPSCQTACATDSRKYIESYHPAATRAVHL